MIHACKRWDSHSEEKMDTKKEEINAISIPSAKRCTTARFDEDNTLGMLQEMEGLTFLLIVFLNFK